MGARVSKITLDAESKTTTKVSHRAQTEEGERWAQAQGYEIVGTFEDLGVSAGKTTPWERPDLGKWLAPERLHEWDVLVFSKIDRAFRSTIDCVDFAKWTKANKKILAFSGDGVVLDYLHTRGDSLDQMMSEFFIYVGSFFAAIELSRFKTRAKDRLDYLRMTNRVSHGVAPYGYRTVPIPSGGGKMLERDPDSYATLHQIKTMLVDENRSMIDIVQWLNDAGKLTNVGKARRGGQWSVTTLKRILTSQRTQGLRITSVFEPSPTAKNPDNKKRVGEKLVLDAQGQPIQMAEPTFSETDWERIQEALGQRSARGKGRQMTPNPLGGVGYCICGYSLSLHRRKSSSGKLHTYVRCGRSPRGCRGAMRLDAIETALQENFLDLYGHKEMTKKVFVPGEDRSQELRQTEESITRLRWESDNGLVDDEALYKSRLTALISRKKELTANTVVSASWQEVGTGQTYRELWDAPDTDRRQVLRDAKIRFIMHCPPHGSSTSTKVVPWEFSDLYRADQPPEGECS